MINSEVFLSILVACLSMQSTHAAEHLPAEAFSSRANGLIELSTQRHTPLYVEVVGSSTLSQRLAESLAAKGFTIVPDKAAARAVLSIRGDIALQGGPNFSSKGVKVGIGDAVEKSLSEAKDKGGLTQADVVQTVAAVGINAAGFANSITHFWQGLYLSNMASALGDVTGAKAGFNRALTGDARGICLSRCDDWNKVNQTVYLLIELQEGAAKKEIRVLTRAFAEAVAPQEVLDHALTSGVEAIKLVDVPEGVPK